MLKPLMQFVLDEELKAHPEKEKKAEETSAKLGQDLLEKLWAPEEKPTTFWGKVKQTLSDGIDLPQKLFDRMIDFRIHQGLSYKKEETQRVMFYATSAIRKGIEMLARGCYLFYHNPRAFEKYAISSTDFQKDVRQSSFDEENVFMPALAIFPCGTAMAAGQAIQEEYRAEDRRLPLLSFAPIKYGQHPCLIQNQQEIKKYIGLFSDPSLHDFETNPYRFEPLKKLLHFEQPESNYPAMHHNALVIAINEFNRRLEREPVKICTHKGNQTSVDKQHTNE